LWVLDAHPKTHFVRFAVSSSMLYSISNQWLVVMIEGKAVKLVFFLFDKDKYIDKKGTTGVPKPKYKDKR